MNVRATYEASIGTQTHKGAGEYLHWAGCGTVKFTPPVDRSTKASGTMDASMAAVIRSHSTSMTLQLPMSITSTTSA